MCVCVFVCVYVCVCVCVCVYQCAHKNACFVLSYLTLSYLSFINLPSLIVRTCVT